MFVDKVAYEPSAVSGLEPSGPKDSGIYVVLVAERVCFRVGQAGVWTLVPD